MPSVPRLILASWLLGATACGAVVAPPGTSATPTPASDRDAPVEGDRYVETVPEPPIRFVGGSYRIGPWLRSELIGRNWRPGCPVGLDELRAVRVSYWSFRGTVRSGPLIVNEAVARDVLWVFRRLFHARFPIHRIHLPPRYHPPRPEDRFSTRNLTSSFNCRPATGNPGSLSHHSYGWAIDINPLQNPYVRSDGSVLRLAVKPYLDRTLTRRGMIHAGDVVVRSFARIGWAWGGNWTTLKDYMHFSLTGR
jgi:hypothetical protein